MTDASLPSGELAVFIREIVWSAQAYDTDGLRDQLNLALEAMSLGRCLDDVLFPSMRLIGRRWEIGRLDLEAERLATETVRGWLEKLGLGAPEPTVTAPVLLTCGPADLHSVGLEALAVLLRHERKRCRVLGPRTSPRMLAIAIRADRPCGVVVVSHLRANWLGAAQSLRAAAALGVPVFYAGGAFASEAQRQDLPGTHLDAGLRDACALLLAACPA